MGKKSAARPARMAVSTNSTSAADARTTTCPGPATGSGARRTVSTSGPPNLAASTISMTIALPGSALPAR